jgi:lysophospholipase L1-like esterase
MGGLLSMGVGACSSRIDDGASAVPASGQRIDADDSYIQYVGRVDFTDPKAPSFSYPGVQILARFEGSSVGAIIADTGDKDFFNVSIDGKEPTVIQTARGSKTILLAKGLAKGAHTVSIYKRTESNCGAATFGGFVLDARKRLLKPQPLSERRMEFVGDSITCGYGNMISTDHPENAHFTPVNENNALSWGALTAKALDAQFMSTSYSGRGMFRNLDGSEAGTLPRLYRVVYADQPGRAAWNPEAYHPDVIVINLGTNDYGSELTMKDLDGDQFDARFAAAYRAFIADLRIFHGAEAIIVCAVGPMMSDYYPPGKRSWSRIRTVVRYIVDDLNEKGDAKVFYLEFEPQSGPYGEDWHPSLDTHGQMAEAAVELIQRITGW